MHSRMFALGAKRAVICVTWIILRLASSANLTICYLKIDAIKLVQWVQF